MGRNVRFWLCVVNITHEDASAEAAQALPMLTAELGNLLCLCDGTIYIVTLSRSTMLRAHYFGKEGLPCLLCKTWKALVLIPNVGMNLLGTIGS